MSGDFLDIGKARGEWAVAFLVAVIALVIITAAYGVGRAVNRDLGDVSAYVGDPAWVPYQIGTEHARLLLAAETGADADTLKLRGDIYLSFIDRLRRAPQLNSAEAGLQANMAALENSFRATERLLTDVETSEGREALREQLREDATFISDFTLAMSRLYRKAADEERARKEATLR